MAVEEPTQVARLQQARKRPARGRFDLTPSLAQLGWDEGQAERAVEALLVRCGDELAPSPERGAVEREAASGGERRELAAGGASLPVACTSTAPALTGVGDHDLRARAAGESEGEPALVLARELVHARILAEPLEQLGRRHVRDEHEDQVAHDLAAPSNLAGDDRAAITPGSCCSAVRSPSASSAAWCDSR